jgi:hypothetical protein
MVPPAAITGTGGTFIHGEMIILLPNLGIQATTNGLKRGAPEEPFRDQA